MEKNMNEYDQMIVNYLKKKKINVQILENPASNIVYKIWEICQKEYGRMKNNNVFKNLTDSMQFLLGYLVSVDEHGNVKLAGINDDLYEYGYSFSIDENNNYIFAEFSASIGEADQPGYLKPNNYMVFFQMRNYVFDTNGIEEIINERYFNWYNQTLESAKGLAQYHLFYSGFRYHKSIVTKREYDLGSAKVYVHFGDSFIGNSAGCRVKLNGEHIDRLSWNHDAIRLHGDLVLGKTVDDVVKLREKNPSLNFSIDDLSLEERDKYYKWVNREIEGIYNPKTKEAMEKLVKERNLLPSNTFLEDSNLKR